MIDPSVPPSGASLAAEERPPARQASHYPTQMPAGSPSLDGCRSVQPSRQRRTFEHRPRSRKQYKPPDGRHPSQPSSRSRSMAFCFVMKRWSSCCAACRLGPTKKSASIVATTKWARGWRSLKVGHGTLDIALRGISTLASCSLVPAPTAVPAAAQQ